MGAAGYACVRVDSRGCGTSPGFVDPFGPREQKDFYYCIEWAATQPWSTGKVGLNGISYFGSNQCTWPSTSRHIGGHVHLGRLGGLVP